MPPSPAQEVANLFSRVKHESEVDGSLRVITLRVPAGQLAWVDALAKGAHVSRNAMANQLLRVGVSGLLGELPDEIREEVEVDVLDRFESETDRDEFFHPNEDC
jgi:hypothetical protein